MSVQDLAAAAGMSASPAWRRVKRLEESGVIAAQVAILSRQKLGLTVLAYIHVTLNDHAEATVSRFDAFIGAEERVQECARVTGGSDYILKVVARDTEDLEDFLMRHLLAIGVVRTAATSIALRQTKATTALPLG